MLQTLNSYVPLLIRQRVARYPEPLQSAEYQSLEAGVLFADISGFTRLTEQLALGDPRGVEKISTALNDYFGRWIDIINQYGGDVVKFAGDGLLAIWPADAGAGGLPAAAHQAAACALDAHSTLQGYLTAEGNPLIIHTGISCGTIQIVHLGGMFGRWEILVSGEPIIQVSLAMQQAPLGRVALSPAAQEALGKTARGEPCGQGYLALLGLEGKTHKDLSPSPPFEAPQESVAALETYIPGAIKSRISAGQIGWLAELRTVTVMFMNLPELDYRLGLAGAQEIMHDLQSTLYYYEGSLNKLIVDEKGATLLAAFGLPPFSHEDDALRATLVALEIQRKLSARQVQIRIGITTGQAFCGSIGNSLRREYTLVGQTVNLAVRLMQATGNVIEQGPHILADRTTMENTHQRMLFEELPPVIVKGRNEPVAIFRPQIERRHAVHRSEALVGRQAEREQLGQAVTALREPGLQGRRVVVIEGEPGIGKSRQLEDLLDQARQADLSTLSGAADAIEKSTPYYAWRSIFCQLFGLDLSETLEKRRAVLSSKLDSDLFERASLVNDILQVDFPPTELTANMEGRVLAENTRILLTTLLQRSALHIPRLITIEDIHWMDTASWALLLDVARLVRDVPILLVVTTRPFTDPVPLEAEQIKRLPYTKLMQLERLSGEDALALVAHRLGVNDLPEPVRDLIIQKAEGHPFFSEELAYALRDSGLLLIENGRGRLASGITNLDSLNLPNTVQGIITSRIDRLAPGDQFTLKVASVIGRVFAYATLYAIHPIEAERILLRSSLLVLQKLDITPLETPEPDLSYIFKHIITRDVAYNLMLFSQRRQLHKSTADWYEQNHAADLEPHYGLLAHHYALAEDSVKAIFYLEKAGQQALLGGAYIEAANYFEEAVLIADRDTRTIDLSVEQRARWQRQLGDAYLGLGALDRSQGHYEKSAELLGWPSPKNKIALIGRLLGQISTQAWRLVRGSQIRPAAEGAKLLEAARAHDRLVNLYYYAQDRLHLLNSSLHSLNLAQRGGPSPELARAYAIACSVSGVLPAHGLARQYERLALEAAAQIDHLPSQALVFSRTGLYNIGVGDLKQAALLLDQAGEIAERLRDYRQWGESAALRAWDSYLMAEFEDSRSRFEQVYQMAEQVGNTQYQNWGQWGQSHALLRMNRLEEAKHALASVAQRLENQEDSGSQVVAYGLMSIVCLHLKDWKDMLRYGKRVVSADKNPDRFSIADLEGYAGAAEVFLSLWQTDPETNLLAQIEYPLADCMAAARRACEAAARYGRIYPIGQPRAELLNGWLDLLNGLPQKSARRWRAGLRLAQSLGLRYEEARLHQALGRYLRGDDPAAEVHRSTAQRMFEELNAQLDFAAKNY
jgi:class 3 adenylate cyclase